MIHGHPLRLDEAIRACCLDEIMTRQRLHYAVQKECARLRRESTSHCHEQEGVEVVGIDWGDRAFAIVSPLTIDDDEGISIGVGGDLTASDGQELPTTNHNNAAIISTRKRKKSRLSSRQACEGRIEEKQSSDDSDRQYKAAFKEATGLSFPMV